LSKSSPVTELQSVLRLVSAGGRYLTPPIANGDIDRTQTGQGHPGPVATRSIHLDGSTVRYGGTARMWGALPRSRAMPTGRSVLSCPWGLIEEQP
jgi:hypothetical protein